jgi:hypothetical protein
LPVYPGALRQSRRAVVQNRAVVQGFCRKRSISLVTSFVLFRVTSWIAAFVEKNKDDPLSHIDEEVVGVKRKVKTHFTTDAVAPFLF